MVRARRTLKSRAAQNCARDLRYKGAEIKLRELLLASALNPDTICAVMKSFVAAARRSSEPSCAVVNDDEEHDSFI